MRSLQSSLAARLLAETSGRGPWWRPCQSERLPFAAAGTSVRKRAPYCYALPTKNHIEPGFPAEAACYGG